jgi:hypothetical protein
MKCRHQEEAEKESTDLPQPAILPDDFQPELNFWIRCRICGGVEFMIKPFEKGEAVHIICAKCGRLYKLRALDK